MKEVYVSFEKLLDMNETEKTIELNALLSLKYLLRELGVLNKIKHKIPTKNIKNIINHAEEFMQASVSEINIICKWPESCKGKINVEGVLIDVANYFGTIRSYEKTITGNNFYFTDPVLTNVYKSLNNAT